jgi:hypothetical protein
MYFAHIALSGIVKYGELPGSIVVHKEPDKPTPIGVASCRGRDGRGVAWWVLTVHGNELPWLWVISDKIFVAAK